MVEIALPKGNEEEFIGMALRLGIKKICFLYDFETYKSQKPKDLDFDIETGYIVSQENINSARKQSKLLVAKSSDKDRELIEGKKISMIYGFEENPSRDYLHQRASGLNHIICELARKNGVAVGLSYGSILGKSDGTSSLLIGRMMQNMELCRKYNVSTAIGSFSQNPFHIRPISDIKSLFVSFGMNGKNITDSLNYEF